MMRRTVVPDWPAFRGGLDREKSCFFLTAHGKRLKKAPLIGRSGQKSVFKFFGGPHAHYQPAYPY